MLNSPSNSWRELTVTGLLKIINIIIHKTRSLLKLNSNQTVSLYLVWFNDFVVGMAKFITVCWQVDNKSILSNLNNTITTIDYC